LRAQGAGEAIAKGPLQSRKRDDGVESRE